MDENTLYPLIIEETLHVVHESVLTTVSEILVTPLLIAFFTVVFLQIWHHIWHLIRRLIQRMLGRTIVRSENKKISFTVNYVENGVFKIRTIADELAIDEDFLDPLLRLHVKAAWKNTTTLNPVMEFPFSDDEEDDEENGIMSVFQGRVSAKYVIEHMMAAAGLPVDQREYVFMVTYEHYGLEEVRKIRVIFVEKKFLLNGTLDADTLRFEKPHQKTRIRTLQLMRTRYLTLDENRQKKHWAELPFPAHCVHFRLLQQAI